MERLNKEGNEGTTNVKEKQQSKNGIGKTKKVDSYENEKTRSCNDYKKKSGNQSTPKEEELEEL